MKLRRLSFEWGAGTVLALAMALGLGRALAQRPLGTDVSGYQPSINWTTVKNAGVAFAWAKATEGTGYINPYFTAQEAGATGVGIYIGAYHFARPSYHPNITGANSADSEAAYFWSTASNYVKYGGPYLVPMLDWEDPNVTNQLSAATMSAWVNEWCNSVSNYARLNGVPGVRPVVYTGTWYSRPSSTYSGLTTAVTNWPSWIAAYPSNPNPQSGGPSDTYPWPTWNIWQYADTNWSGGDADVFNGTLSQFVQMFVIGGTNAPVINASPTNVTVAVASSATFSVRASGLAPLSFQWLFNRTVIPGTVSSNYTVSNIELTNAGGYSVVVSNSYASVPSSTAFLSVLSQLTNTVGCILVPPNMVNWWPGDGNPNDIFGGNNCTPHNGVSYVIGKQNLAFHFDGATSYLSDGAASIFASWTACMWVNRQNAAGTAAALMGDGSYELKLEQYNGTRQVGLTRFGAWDASFGYIVPAGTWTHLSFVGTSAGTTLYVNGALQATLTNTLPLPRAYIGAGYVASNSKFVDYMLGSLDEILLFSRALSGSEIIAIYAAGSAGLVRAPEFTGTTPLGNGRFQLNLRGQTGKNFTIYASSDLATWTTLGSVPNPSGSTQYTDNSATNAQTLYRASQP
jgi:GH25 family lysozyme M1 (1,4-beta-N-acetylmuramidase)